MGIFLGIATKNAYLLFPVRRFGKRFRKRFSALLLAFLPLPAWAQAPGALTFPRAVQVQMGRTGIHTHADFILFDTGHTDLAAWQKDAGRYPGLKIVARCRLGTDHAALPPELAAPGDPPLPNPYGPIDGGGGRPGWGILPETSAGRHHVRVLVPTRFANWLAGQTPARRRAYLDPRSYRLEVRWNAPIHLPINLPIDGRAGTSP